MNLTIKPYLRPWVMGCLGYIVGVIGADNTIKGVQAAIEYVQTHPLPEAPAPTNAPPIVVVTNEPPQTTGETKTNLPPIVVHEGARLVSVKSIGSMMSVTVEGWEQWPVNGGKKDTFGKLMIGTRAKPSGEYVDALTKSQMRGGRKTLKNAFGHGEHSIDVQRGETVMVWVRSWDGRETNKLPFVWIWEST